jgi:tetratricopeptide (TPR) repeat protein
MRRYPEVVRYADRAISLQPAEPFGYYLKATAYLCWDGDVERARNVFEEASRHIDRSELYYWLVSGIYRWRTLRFLAAPPSALDRGLNPKNPWYFVAKAALSRGSDRLGLGRAYYDSARVMLETASKNRLSDGRYHSLLGIAYAGLGRYEDAIRLAEEAVEMSPVDKDALYGPYWVANLAEVHLMAGNHDEAIDQLERLLSLPAVESIPLLQVDPIWDPLRDHPRFQALVAKYQ